MKKKDLRNINLLDLKPRRNLQSETAADERVTLHIPKFRNRFAVRWIVPMLSHPTIRVTLDEHGSYIWNQCDGATTIGDIAEAMKKKHGDDFDPEYKRIGAFVGRLLTDDFIIIDPIYNNPPA